MNQIPLRHVALVIASLRMGGAERASVNLLNALSKKGIQCDLVLVQKEGELLDEVDPSVNIIDLAKPRTLFAAGAMTDYLSVNKPQVLVAAQTHVQLMALYARRKSSLTLPLVLNEHSPYSLNKPASFWKSALTGFLSARLFPDADAVTAVSKAVSEDFTHAFPALKNKVSIIHNAVVTPLLHQQSHDFSLLPVDLTDGKPFILGAGRLSPEKDFQILLRAFSLVRKTRDINLLILGNGPEKQNLQILAQELGILESVSLYGYTKNPYAFMRRAEVFVLSSQREGSPMVLVEALACSCPVISSDCPGGSSEILADGKYGRLFRSGDAQDLADAITDVLNGIKPEFDTAKPVEEYTSEYVCEQYLELFHKLLNSQKQK